MKKWVRRIFKLLAAFLLLLLFAVVLAVLYGEWHGVPVVAKSYLEKEFLRRGYPVNIGHLRATPFGGITMRNVEVFYDAQKQERLAVAERIHFDVEPRSLLEGMPDIKAVSVDNAEVELPGGFSSDFRETMRLRQTNFHLRIEGENLQVTELSTNIAGVTVRLRGKIRGFKSVDKKVSQSSLAESQADNIFFQNVAIHILNLRPQFQRVYSLLQMQEQNVGQGQFEAVFDLPLNSPEKFSCKGRFLIPDPVLGQVAGQKIQGQLIYNESLLQLKALTVVVSHEDILQGNIEFQLPENLVKAELQGHLRVNTALALLKQEKPDWLTPLDLTAPVKLSANLAPSPWNQINKWKANLSFQIHNGFYEKFGFRVAEGNLDYQDNTITARDLRVIAQSVKDELSGAIKLSLADGAIEANLQGRLNPVQWLSQFGVGLPSSLLELKWQKQPPLLELNVNGSTQDWRSWQGKGRFAGESANWRNFSLDRFATDFTFAPDRVSMKDISLSWLGIEKETIQAQVDIVKNTDEPVFQATVNAALQDSETETDTSLDLKVDLQQEYKPSITISGSANVKDFYLSLGDKLHLPHLKALDNLVFAEAPQFQLKWQHDTRQPEDWKINGSLSVEDVSYRNRRFVSAAGTILLSSTSLSFQQIQAESSDGTELKGDIEIKFKPLLLTLSGTIDGDPEAIDIFVSPARARDIYKRVWRDFSWDKNAMPHAEIRELKFAFNPHDRNWRLTMNSHLSAENIVYRDFRAETMDIDIELNLPRRLKLNNIKISWDKSKTAEADIAFRFEGQPACHFALSATADPREVLNVINPEWQPFGDLEFDALSTISCNGNFDIRPQALPQLKGQIYTDLLKFRKLSCTDARIVWVLQNNQLTLPVVNLDLHGGEISASAYYDMTTKAGLCDLDVRNVPLRPLLSDLGAVEAPPEAVGLVSGKTHLQFLRDWSNQPLQLNGTGNLSLREGNLWQVPFFEQLGMLLDVTFLSRISRGKLSGLGRISELQADLQFAGSRVNVPTLTTNGTIVALKGEGQYQWDTQKLHFAVQGQALKKVRVFWFFLRPLSWVFDAELTGSLQDYNWRLLSKLGRILSGKPPEEKELGD